MLSTGPLFNEVICFYKDFSSRIGYLTLSNAGDPSSIPGSGRSPEEGIGYPIQYSWASLVAQLVKDPSAMQETWVQSLGWDDPLKKGKATHSSILAWRIPWFMGLQSVGDDWATFTSLSMLENCSCLDMRCLTGILGKCSMILIANVYWGLCDGYCAKHPTCYKYI